MKVQFIVSVATVLLSAVPSAFAAEPVLRGSIVASDSFLDRKRDGNRPGGKGYRDYKGPKGYRDYKGPKGYRDYKDWEKKGGSRHSRCARMSDSRCERSDRCELIIGYGRNHGTRCVSSHPYDFEVESASYYSGDSSEDSFVAKGASIKRKGIKGLDKNFGRKIKGLDKKTLCKDLKKIKGLDRKVLRSLCGKRMESEDYYDFEVESDYDSGDSFYSEDFEDEDLFDSFLDKKNDGNRPGGKGRSGRSGYKNWEKKGHGYKNWEKKGHKNHKCYNLSRSECKKKSGCTLLKHGRKNSGDVCVSKNYYYDFEEESPYYDSGDSSYSEDFEDEDLFDSEDFDFDSEDFDSEDFDFDSEDFDFDYEDFDSEDFE